MDSKLASDTDVHKDHVCRGNRSDSDRWEYRTIPDNLDAADGGGRPSLRSDRAARTIERVCGDDGQATEAC